jgi:nitrite reductase/ring-hydroxylating ferredoxin subunit
MWILLGPASQIPEGEVRTFPVDGLSFSILVANLGGGQFAASSAICPHEDVSLEEGFLDAGCITCPGHGYQFDLRTGRCRHDPSLVLPRFPVELRRGELFVQLNLLRLA